MRLAGKVCFDIFWIIFFGGILIISLGYNPKARLIPLVVSIPCVAMAAYRLVVDLKGKEEKGLSTEKELTKGIMERIEGVTAPQKKKEKIAPEEKRRRLLDITLWILIFTGLIYVLGLLYAIPIFTFSYMRSKKEGWVLALACALGLLVCVYLAFIVGTKSQLYEGLVIPWIRRAIL
jgi:hypothetical protein